MNKPYAKLGAVLINAALWLFWLKLWAWSVGVSACVGLIDLYLVKRDKPTISAYVWKKWKIWGDLVFLTASLATTWALLGLPFAAAFLAGAIQGHLRTREDEESPNA